MSSRVGTAIPASRSTARSSSAVGFTRSIQTAFSGNASASAKSTFFREDSEGTYTDNMRELRNGAAGLVSTRLLHASRYSFRWKNAMGTQQDQTRFWQALDDWRINRPS